MDVRTIDYYGACDEAIKALNRWSLEAFGRLKLAKWDELNVIREVRTVYRESARRAKKRYYEVAFEAYLLMCSLCGIDPKAAQRTADKAITPEWVADVLDQTDFVTMYRFNTEMDRKAIRLAEALEVAENRNAEVDKALRFWSQQLGQYAINMTDYAMIQAVQDAGVEWVEWVTMKDERVCSECRPRDGKVYRIDEIPPKHWGCRCRMNPVWKAPEE